MCNISPDNYPNSHFHNNAADDLASVIQNAAQRDKAVRIQLQQQRRRMAKLDAKRQQERRVSTLLSPTLSSAAHACAHPHTNVDAHERRDDHGGDYEAKGDDNSCHVEGDGSGYGDGFSAVEDLALRQRLENAAATKALRELQQQQRRRTARPVLKATRARSTSPSVSPSSISSPSTSRRRESTKSQSKDGFYRRRSVMQLAVSRRGSATPRGATRCSSRPSSRAQSRKSSMLRSSQMLTPRRQSSIAMEEADEKDSAFFASLALLVPSENEKKEDKGMRGRAAPVVKDDGDGVDVNGGGHGNDTDTVIASADVITDDYNEETAALHCDNAINESVSGAGGVIVDIGDIHLPRTSCAPSSMPQSVRGSLSLHSHSPCRSRIGSPRLTQPMSPSPLLSRQSSSQRLSPSLPQSSLTPRRQSSSSPRFLQRGGGKGSMSKDSGNGGGVKGGSGKGGGVVRRQSTSVQQLDRAQLSGSGGRSTWVGRKTATKQRYSATGLKRTDIEGIAHSRSQPPQSRIFSSSSSNSSNSSDGEGGGSNDGDSAEECSAADATTAASVNDEDDDDSVKMTQAQKAAAAREALGLSAHPPPSALKRASVMHRSQTKSRTLTSAASSLACSRGESRAGSQISSQFASNGSGSGTGDRACSLADRDYTVRRTSTCTYTSRTNSQISSFAVSRNDTRAHNSRANSRPGSHICGSRSSSGATSVSSLLQRQPVIEAAAAAALQARRVDNIMRVDIGPRTFSPQSQPQRRRDAATGRFESTKYRDAGRKRSGVILEATGRGGDSHVTAKTKTGAASGGDGVVGVRRSVFPKWLVERDDATFLQHPADSSSPTAVVTAADGTDIERSCLHILMLSPIQRSPFQVRDHLHAHGITRFTYTIVYDCAQAHNFTLTVV